MAEENEGEEQFFKDLGATVEQTVIRIQSEYIQKCFQSLAAQMRDFVETYANVASGAIKAPSLYSLE
jgi:hypothetical protein